MYGNYFHEFYRGIKESPQRMEQVVRDDPELAFRIFDIFRDREIGKLLVVLYAENPEHHHSAYFVSLELGNPIERLPVQPTSEINYEGCVRGWDPNWDPNRPPKMLHFRGKRHDENYYEENAWDNLVSAYEKSS